MRWRMDSVHGSAPKMPARSGSSRMSMPISRGALDEVQKIGGRAAHGRDAEVFHEHDLPVGVAARSRNHRSAQALGAVVRAQAAGKEAVAVGDLNDVAAMQAAAGQAADDRRGPDVHIFLRVGDDDRLAGGSAGCVQADHVLHGAGEEAEGISVAQIALLR